MTAFDDAVLTVRGLVGAMGPSMVEVLSDGAGVERRAGRLTVWEPDLRGALEPDDVVVAVGGRGPHFQDIWGSARAAGAAAVVVRAAATATSLPAADGPAVLGLADEVGWDSFLTAAGAVLARGSAGGPWAPFGDLFAFADAVAAAVGAPVVIDDHRLRLLAYSSLPQPVDALRMSSIVARRVPERELDRLRHDGLLRRLWQGDDVVRLSGFAGAADRLAVAVRAGNEVLGAIIVAEPHGALDDDAVALLRHAADMAAAHLLHAHHRSGQNDVRARAAAAVLDGDLSDDAGAALPPQGSGRRVVALVGDAAAEARRRLVELLAVRLRAAGMSAVTAVPGPGADCAVYAVISDAEPLVPMRTAIERIVGDGESMTGSPVRAAIGSVAHDVAGIGRSRRHADQLLRLGSLGTEPVLAFEDWRHRLFLSELHDVEVVRHGSGTATVQAMADHDRAHGTTYVQTLRAYLDALANASVAAEALHVHHNTVRYRVARVQARFGIDLDDPVERLVTQLGLHLLDVAVPA